MIAIASGKSVNQLHWISAISLAVLTTLTECKPTGDSFYSPRSEENYNYNPHHGQYNPRGESYPESHRDVQYQYQAHHPYPYVQAASYLEPDIQVFQNGQFHPPQTGYGYGGHSFQPEVSSMLFENPLKKAMEDGKAQAEKSLQQMQERMSEAGKQLEERAGKKGEETGKQMKGMMEGAEPGADGESPVPPPPSPTDLPDSRSLKKKGEDGDDHEEKKDDKSEAKEGDNNPLKKLMKEGSEMMKKIPEAMGMPKLMARFAGIRDETTEARDHYDEDGEWPRAERAEWGVPDMYDVRMHPRSDYFDYYDGHY